MSIWAHRMSVSSGNINQRRQGKKKSFFLEWHAEFFQAS